MINNSVETISFSQKEKHKMLDFLTAYLVKPIMERQFSVNYSTEVDRYVASKNPQTIADVEHWEKEYSRKQNQGWAL